jgi:pimeloyl-ACP methyl ester carboxylesterase
MAGFVLLLAIVFATAAAYDRWAFRHYRSSYKLPGQLFTVDGFKMHLFCTGSGTPTVILESGVGDDALKWARVQPELSKVTRVCSYDRAGLGWSDPRPDLRDSNSIADQLHGLLTAAQITGPIILMGHSIAGLHLRAYVSRHPEAVAGLVLVDAATPEQIERLRPFTQRFMHQLVWIKPLMKMGIGRLLRRCGDTPPGNVKAYAGWYKADNYCNPGYPEAFERELEAYPESVFEVARTGPFGDLPILIFSQDPRFGSDGAGVTYRFQESLQNLSSRSRRIIARNSTHYIQFDRADLLNLEVPIFIRQIRGEVTGPASMGTENTSHGSRR